MGTPLDGLWTARIRAAHCWMAEMALLPGGVLRRKHTNNSKPCSQAVPTRGSSVPQCGAHRPLWGLPAHTHTHTQTEQSLPLHSLFSPLLILQSPSAWLSMESPWGPSKAAWMGSWAPCSRCLCLSRGWSRWTQRALPTSAILCSS